MTLPSTLPDPRHEAFAVHLARGDVPASAYRKAGLGSVNHFERGAELAKDPDIAARVQHLRDCIPHMDALCDHYAPSLLLIPETKDEMLAWLWQVMNGTRKILPLQLRAATLFTRLKGWHLQKSGPHSPLCGQDLVQDQANKAEAQPQSTPDTADSVPVPATAAPAAGPEAPRPPIPRNLIQAERTLLAIHNRANVQTDALLRSPLPDNLITFTSSMADYAFAAALKFPETRPIPFITNFFAKPTASAVPPHSDGVPALGSATLPQDSVPMILTQSAPPPVSLYPLPIGYPPSAIGNSSPPHQVSPSQTPHPQPLTPKWGKSESDVGTPARGFGGS